MSQELIYKVRFQEEKQDLLNIRKELEKLGKDSGAGVKTDPSTIKETQEAVKAIKQKDTALKELRKTLRAKQEALAGWQKQTRQGHIASKQSVEIQRALGITIAETKSQIESATKGNIDYNNAIDLSAMSLREMKGQLRAIKLAIDEVKDPLGTGADEVKKLTERAGELNTKLKDVEKDMGIFSRNVGNYASANDGLVTSLRSGANAMAIFQGPLGPIAGRINSAATAISRFKQANEQATISTRVLGLSIKTALIASGIGLLIVALGSLRMFFKRTEEGQERLRVITARLGAIFGTLADRVTNFGKVLSDAFTSPKGALELLTDFIQSQFINRIAAIPEIAKSAFSLVSNFARATGLAVKGIWSEDAREESKKLFIQAGKDFLDYQNNVAQLITGIEDPLGKLARLGLDIKENMDFSAELEESLNAVLRVERQLGVERAKQNRDFQEARDLVRDLTVSFDERLEALDRVRKGEEELLQREIANERERLRIMQEKNDMFASTAEQNQAVADQQIRIFDLEREALNRSMSARRDENAIIRQRNEFLLRGMRRALEEADRGRELEIARIRRRYEQEGKIVELAEMKKMNFLETRLAEEEALYEAYYQELKNQYVDHDEAKRFAREKANQEMALREIEINNELQDAIQDRERARIEEDAMFDRMVAQRELDARLHQLSQNNDQVAMIEEERRAWQEMAEREHGMRLEQITRELTERGIEEKEAEFMAKLRLQEEYNQKSQELDQRLADAVKANREQMLDAIATLTKNSIQAIFGDSKAGAIAMATIDTLQGINKALGSSPPPLNFLNAAAVGAAGFANVRRIMSTQLGGTPDTSTTSITPPTTSFGLVELPTGLGAEMASQQPPSVDMQPVVVLEGEFDPEFLSVKVRQGNDKISGNTLGIGI